MRKDLSALPELLNGGESRQLAGITSAAWMELLETDQLPKPVKVAGRFKWRKSDILKWIAEMQPQEVFK